MNELVKRAAPNNNYYWGGTIISLKLNLRDCDRPLIMMLKLLLLGYARFTNFGFTKSHIYQH